MKKQIYAKLMATIAVIMIIRPFGWFAVCSKPMKNGMPMSCFYSNKLLIGMGVLILVVSIQMIRKDSKKVNMIGYIINFVAALSCYILPKRIIEVGHMKVDGWQIGLCGSEEMICHSAFMHSTTIVVVLVCVIALVGFIFNQLQEN